MKNIRLLALAGLLLSLAACGGGGGSDDDDGGGNGGGGEPSNPGGDNTAPVARAGKPQNVLVKSKVRLDGSASSDADGDPIFYTWTFDSRPSDSNAKLQSADSAVPVFTADVAGNYVARLVVNDDTDSSKPDTVKVVAAARNARPVADAGESREVKTGSTVTLDGTASSDAGDQAASARLSYEWSIVSQPDSDVQLANANTARPSFIAGVAGVYVVQLVVSDGKFVSEPAQVTIRATSGNAAPVADAGGDRGVRIGAMVELDGSASSDVEGDELDYAWQLISAPQGSGAELSDADAATPSFVADATGSYVVELMVSDDDGASDRDRIVIAAGPTLELAADLNNEGNFKDADLPYEETLEQTVTHAPNTSNNNDNGFALGKFRAKAVGSDLTLNLSFNLDRLNESSGGYALAFDRFQGLGNPVSKQIILPQGEERTFTVNAGIPPKSKAFITYSIAVVETGDTFEASYTVESNDN